MTNYKLFRYGGASMDEDLVFESSNLGDAVLVGLGQSEEGREGCGVFTYRLESWIDYELQYGFRYFNNGKEITADIRKAILESIVTNT